MPTNSTRSPGVMRSRSRSCVQSTRVVRGQGSGVKGLGVRGCWLQQQVPERRKVQTQRLFVAVRRQTLGRDHALVPKIAAAVNIAVAVDDLEVRPRKWDADAITISRHWREIHQRDKRLSALAAAQERDDAVF